MKLPAVWLMVILIFCGYGMYIGIAYMDALYDERTRRIHHLRGHTRHYPGFRPPHSDRALQRLYFRQDRLHRQDPYAVLPCPHRDAVRVAPPARRHLQHGDYPAHYALQLLWAGGIYYHVLMYGRSPHSAAVHRHLGQRDQSARLPADGIFSPLFGHWLDVYGNEGYTVIFYFLATISLIGAMVSLLIYRRGKAMRNAQ